MRDGIEAVATSETVDAAEAVDGTTDDGAEAVE
jgi:hypothetical protein